LQQCIAQILFGLSTALAAIFMHNRGVVGELDPAHTVTYGRYLCTDVNHIQGLPMEVKQRLLLDVNMTLQN